MRRVILLLACLAAVSAWSCGNGVVLISVNSGLVVGAPRCGGGGEFDLRDRGGLTLLVVITSSTRILLAGGGTGTCTSLAAGDAVQVSGHRDGDRIVASVVTIE
jgi:hypothetical protein